MTNDQSKEKGKMKNEKKVFRFKCSENERAAFPPEH